MIAHLLTLLVAVSPSLPVQGSGGLAVPVRGTTLVEAGEAAPVGGREVMRVEADGEQPAPPPRADMTRIPGGRYVPLYSPDGRAVAVEAFELDRRPVTRAEFLAFVRENPEWRRSRVKPVFADDGYLFDWDGDLDYGGAEDAGRPVTDVSWFAANAYCRWRGARLPTLDEWEYVARADERRRDATDDEAFRRRMLELATRPQAVPPAPVGSGLENVYGVADMHGLVREWVFDFNSVLSSADSRGTGVRDPQLYCAAGATGATDRDDYAGFLRYAFRASLDGTATIGNLGFRCARSMEE